MIDFSAVKKRRELQGVTVMSFMRFGSGPSSHRFMWAGKVERFEDFGGKPFAVARVLKRDNMDIREGEIGTVRIPLHDPDLQQLHGSVYAWIK